MSTVSLVLIGKPDCHLCDDARGVITDVLADFGGIQLQERSILDDPELYERYWEQIPVVLVNEKVHAIWRVKADRLRVALRKVTNAPHPS